MFDDDGLDLSNNLAWRVASYEPPVLHNEHGDVIFCTGTIPTFIRATANGSEIVVKMAHGLEVCEPVLESPREAWDILTGSARQLTPTLNRQAMGVVGEDMTDLDDPGEEGALQVYPQKGFCPACSRPSYDTPSGPTCGKHGGLEPVESSPDDPQRICDWCDDNGCDGCLSTE